MQVASFLIHLSQSTGMPHELLTRFIVRQYKVQYVVGRPPSLKLTGRTKGSIIGWELSGGRLTFSSLPRSRVSLHSESLELIPVCMYVSYKFMSQHFFRGVCGVTEYC